MTKKLSVSPNDFDLPFWNWQGDIPHWTNMIPNFLEGMLNTQVIPLFLILKIKIDNFATGRN